MMDAKAMENEKPSDNLHIALIGKEQSGKSRLAVTGRQNTLLLDYDKKRSSIAGRKGVYAITLADEAWPKMPSVAPETLDILAGLEGAIDQEAGKIDLSLVKIGGAQLLDVPKGTYLGTVVADSIGSFAKSAMAYCLYTTQSLRREINIGGKLQVHIPKSYDGWGAEMAFVESAVLRMLGLPCDVIITLHESAEEAPDSTDENPKFTGRVTVYPVRYSRLLKYFPEVWRLTRTGQVPTVSCVADYNFTSGSAFVKQPIKNPNILEIIQENK